VTENSRFVSLALRFLLCSQLSNCVSRCVSSCVSSCVSRCSSPCVVFPVRGVSAASSDLAGRSIDVPALRFLYVNTLCCVFVQFAFCVSAPFLLRFRCIALDPFCSLRIALRYRYIALELRCVPMGHCIAFDVCSPVAFRGIPVVFPVE
jgi:hypothetical protein